MVGMTGPSWADIPLDLAGRILGRLLAHVDRLRFAAVCPEWRSAAQQVNVYPPLPLLLLPDATVYSVPETKPFRLPDCTGYADACGNWLVFSGEDGYFLRDPFSNATVPLPALSRDRLRYIGDESLDEADLAWMREGHRLRLEEPKRWKLMFCSPDLIAAIVSVRTKRRIAVCQPGTNSCWSVSVENHYAAFVDMAFHQGKLYALTIRGILFAIDISVDSSTGNPWVSEMRSIIDDQTFPFPLVTKMTYLVESRGVLLLVVRDLHLDSAEGVTGRALPKTAASEQDPFVVFEASMRQVEVFEANLSQSQWTKVTTVGDDQVLFLRRRCCRSVCVSHEEVPGDCIFFLDNDDEDCTWSKATSSSCRAYSMRDGKVSTPLPTVSWKRGSVFATWLFPQN